MINTCKYHNEILDNTCYAMKFGYVAPNVKKSTMNMNDIEYMEN